MGLIRVGPGPSVRELLMEGSLVIYRARPGTGPGMACRDPSAQVGPGPEPGLLAPCKDVWFLPYVYMYICTIVYLKSFASQSYSCTQVAHSMHMAAHRCT